MVMWMQQWYVLPLISHRILYLITPPQARSRVPQSRVHVAFVGAAIAILVAAVVSWHGIEACEAFVIHKGQNYIGKWLQVLQFPPLKEIYNLFTR